MQPSTSSTSAWAARPPAELLLEQLQGLDTWNQARVLQERSAALRVESQEARMMAARRLDARRREQATLLARAAKQLEGDNHWLGADVPRAVIAHRQSWFAGQLGSSLEQHGAVVLETVDDGADAVAIAVLDQPDLVILEERLPHVPGGEVVQRLSLLAPQTLTAVQVEHSQGMADLFDAGAAVVATRRIPPHVLVEEALACLQQGRTRVCLA